MQPGTKRILRFLGNWAINTLAVAVAVMILRNHISYGNNVVNLLMVSLLLGILNAFVRPILMLFALPLLIFTLGLFTFVINALLLYLCQRAAAVFSRGQLSATPFSARSSSASCRWR